MMKFLPGLILLFSCTSHVNNSKTSIPVNVKFNTSECTDVRVDRLDVGKTFEWLHDKNHDHGNSNENIILDQPNLVEVERILTVPVTNNEANFILKAELKDLPDY